jgi:cell shape-determining protein MreC
VRVECSGCKDLLDNTALRKENERLKQENERLKQIIESAYRQTLDSLESYNESWRRYSEWVKSVEKIESDGD